MKKRAPTNEERELFEATLKGARPLKSQTRPAGKVQAQKTPQDARVRPQMPGPGTPHAPSAGLDGRTAERLRRGQLEPEARLDLHGLTEANAHRALLTFVKGAHARGHRLVLVVTGKGAKAEPLDAPFDLQPETRARGVLRAMTPRWLEERELARLVADVRSAHRVHGGTGALYIYLRKRAK